MQISEHGYTVIELLIALAISGVIMSGLFGLAISSSRFYVSQNGVVGMVADGRAALEFMTRELRLAYGTPTLSTTVATNDTISFNRVEDGGFSTGGGTSTQLRDTRKAWTADGFDPTGTRTYTVTIIAGTGSGQSPRAITDNNATQLMISPAWTVTPDTTSHYVITSPRAFTRTSATDHILRYRIGLTGLDDQLAEHITSHAFALPNATTVTVTVTARTKARDPTTQQYRSTTVTETVRRRNP